MENSRISEQFEHLPDILATFYGQKRFCIPTDQERVQSSHMLQQCLENYRTVSFEKDHTVDHAILFEKLERYGVAGHLHDWFKNYLQDHQQM